MEVVHGKQKETSIYIYDDYVYHIDSRNENIFRCNIRRTKGCRGSVILQDNYNVLVVQNHNHSRSPFVKVRIEMKKEMLRLSRDTSLGLKEIFDSVCRSTLAELGCSLMESAYGVPTYGVKKLDQSQALLLRLQKCAVLRWNHSLFSFYLSTHAPVMIALCTYLCTYFFSCWAVLLRQNGFYAGLCSVPAFTLTYLIGVLTCVNLQE